MDRTPDNPEDMDLDDPAHNNLTTPDLDGDDVQEVDDANVGGADHPSKDKDS